MDKLTVTTAVHAKAIAATEADNPHRDQYTSRWGTQVGSEEETREWLRGKHLKEKEMLLASFEIDEDEAAASTIEGALRVMLMKMCSKRGLFTAGDVRELQSRLREWHAAREDPIPNQPEDRSIWDLQGRRDDLVGSLVVIKGCVNAVVRMWLESPKLLLGAYVSLFAEQNVAGQSIRTMADLKSLGEPEGEVHMDQLISISGMKKAEGKRKYTRSITPVL